MREIIQRPRVCSNAHCGAMCCPAQAKAMLRMYDDNPQKCLYYERRDDLYRQTEILDKLKQARDEIESRSTYDGLYIDRADVLEILDKLIESEVKRL